MDSLTFIYLTYSFIALYFLFLFGLIYLENRKEIYTTPKAKRDYSLTIIVPCFNAAKDIGHTIETLLKSDYKGLKKIIVVDDCSTDDSYKIIKEYAKEYSKVLAVQTPKNSGNAAGAKNYGARLVKTELIGFTDDDSSPKSDAIRKMVGFFNDKKVGAVTSRVLVKRRDKFWEQLQSIEYKIIAFTRKLLEFIGAIYVTNGPLSIYRKSAYDDVGGFDENNMTEDIEITWHFVSKGWDVKMSIPSKVYTLVPHHLKSWFRQRIRWNVGGMQTINKYKKSFLGTGMLGLFILPFFLLSWALGIFGFGILVYRLARSLFVKYLSTMYSVKAQTAILRMNEINLTPDVLVFFGVAILTLSISFNLLALFYSREKEYKDVRLFKIIIYMFAYLLLYPILLITSIYKFLRKYHTW